MTLHAENIIKSLKPIGLEEAEQVKLFNRTDQKFIFNVRLVADLLESLKDEYEVLSVNGWRNQPYRSLYFDTPGHAMYYSHHNGHLNRYKIRYREYTSSRALFLEIKFKSNQDRTIKMRQAAEKIESPFDAQSVNFLASNTIYAPGNLLPQVWTNFNRITLIHKDRKERVTIDTNPEWEMEEQRVMLPSLVIAEIKREKLLVGPFGRNLFHAGFRPTGISKYSIGCALLTPGLRTNMFKATLLTIQKICQDELPSVASAGIRASIRN